jgi:hypothetical protein
MLNIALRPIQFHGVFQIYRVYASTSQLHTGDKSISDRRRRYSCTSQDDRNNNTVFGFTTYGAGRRGLHRRLASLLINTDLLLLLSSPARRPVSGQREPTPASTVFRKGYVIASEQPG